MSEPDPHRQADIAVLIPCHNEEAAIAKVIASFREALPSAGIFVYDNNSSDQTAAIARASGAVVRRAGLQGKGNVIRRMFADVDADIYVLVDGDGTYDATIAPELVGLLVEEGLDMVSGARASAADDAYRFGHRIGNRVLTRLVREMFGSQLNDMLTGYRVFSRRFVKSFPSHSRGFEIETELTVHALQMRAPWQEVQTRYGAREVGSFSKLDTIRDGLRILRMISVLVRDERPLQFFGAVGLLLTAFAGALGVIVLIDFLNLHAVPRFPTLIVAVGIAVVGLLSFTCGLILDTVSRAKLEQRQLAYLAFSGPQHLVFDAAVSSPTYIKVK